MRGRLKIAHNGPVTASRRLPGTWIPPSGRCAGGALLRRVVAAVLLTAAAVAAVSHPGGTAADGCHTCRTNCAKWNVKADVRHCHNGSDASEREPEVAACPAGTGERWRGLVVAPECPCTPYDRDDYDYPQSVEIQIAERLGGMVSPYDGTRFESLKESDIEHIVAVSEAHDSGLCAASLTVRAHFARDLDNLTLATPRLNRHEKGAKDAAEWLPERNRCWFAATIVAVRREYGLTIDRREADALDAVLAGCE